MKAKNAAPGTRVQVKRDAIDFFPHVYGTITGESSPLWDVVVDVDGTPGGTGYNLNELRMVK